MNMDRLTLEFQRLATVMGRTPTFIGMLDGASAYKSRVVPRAGQVFLRFDPVNGNTLEFQIYDGRGARKRAGWSVTVERT